MIEKLTDEEIELAGFLLDPVCLVETLMPLNMGSPALWMDDDCPMIQLRNYQFAMLAYDYLYIDDPELSERQNFLNRKGMADCFNIAARNLGKSWMLIWDSLLRIIYGAGKQCIVASFDQKHLRDIFEPIAKIFEGHDFFKMFHLKGNKKAVSRNPYRIDTIHGELTKGINEKVNELSPGEDFHGTHAEVHEYEEFSYASPEGTVKRIDSKAKYGAIERYSGIPDIKIGFPLGDILRDPSKQNWICRLPQYVKHDWDETMKEEKIKEYKGKSSLNYKINVEADLIEGEYGKWDMNRIRKNCLVYDTPIKFFEIDEKIFKGLDKFSTLDLQNEELSRRLKEKLPIVRYPSDKIIVASDIGTTGSQSEVTIYFGDKENNWKYEYNISLFNMTLKEQARVFKWIYTIMGSCFISLDCTNADGRGIRDELKTVHKIPEAHLMNFMMTKNIEVGHELDDDGKVKRDKSGKPIVRVENTKAWSIHCLETIFYGCKIKLLYDEKMLSQFSCFYEHNNGGRLSWGSSTEEHLHDSFLLFALTAWFIEDKNNNNQPTRRIIGYI